MAAAAQLGARSGIDAQVLWDDDGITLHLAEGDEPPDAGLLLPAAEQVEGLVLQQLPSSGLFAAQFRENAARALLLGRRRPGARIPLWAQRLAAQRLLGVALTYPSFPIVVETFRSCLQEVLDVPGLRTVLAAIHDGAIRVHEAETRVPSPMARALVFADVAAHMYAGDLPAAERRAGSAAVDPEVLRELLGAAPARPRLSDADAASLEAELQRLEPGRAARSPDELHDLLRSLGELSDGELRQRCAEAPDAWLSALQARGVVLGPNAADELGAGRWCHVEVTRALRRRARDAAQLDAAPVDAAALTRFLLRWHGIDAPGPLDLERVLERLEGYALPWRELERMVLPARGLAAGARALDALAASGELCWVAKGTGRPSEHRITLLTRARVGLLGPGPEQVAQTAELGATCLALLDHLARQGACFLAELGAAGLAPTQRSLVAALWSLVWAGLVTNDSLAPLRARGHGAAHATRRAGLLPEAQGRWALAAPPGRPAPSATAAAHARVEMLLRRYGLGCRETYAAEELPGGVEPLRAVAREMMRVGQLRRGFFVAGLSASQLALPEALELLRLVREPCATSHAVVVAAGDPANPYGALVPWPALGATAVSSPRRVPGAVVVLVAGRPVLYLDGAGHHLRSFAGTPSAEAARAARALANLGFRRRGLRIEQIDGQAARRAPLAALLREAGFASDHKGLVLE